MERIRNDQAFLAFLRAEASRIAAALADVE